MEVPGSPNVVSQNDPAMSKWLVVISRLGVCMGCASRCCQDLYPPFFALFS